MWNYIFGTRLDYPKLKSNLRISITRLKLKEKKMTELNEKIRKDISQNIAANKLDKARIYVEQLIQQDNLIEGMELVEMFCDLLLARFGLIESQSTIDPGLEESLATILWVFPRLKREVGELSSAGELLTVKYSKEFAQACQSNLCKNVNEKVMHKFDVCPPSPSLVEKYMVEIASCYNVPYTPDQSKLFPDEVPDNFDLPSPPGWTGHGKGPDGYTPGWTGHGKGPDGYTPGWTGHGKGCDGYTQGSLGGQRGPDGYTQGGLGGQRGPDGYTQGGLGGQRGPDGYTQGGQGGPDGYTQGGHGGPDGYTQRGLGGQEGPDGYTQGGLGGHEKDFWSTENKHKLGPGVEPGEEEFSLPYPHGNEEYQQPDIPQESPPPPYQSNIRTSFQSPQPRNQIFDDRPASPSNRQIPPSNQQTTPNNQQTPFSNLQIPPSNQQTPPSNQQTPFSNRQIPPSNQQTPPSNQQTPPSNQQTPPSNQQIPPSNQQTPFSNRQIPPSNQQTPPSNRPNAINPVDKPSELDLPELPDIPPSPTYSSASESGNDDLNFDDLSKRFENLKNRK